MSGGATQTGTQTTSQVLSPEQQDLMKLAMPGLKQFAANPIQYPGQTVAGTDPSQAAGQSMALGNVGAQNSLAQTGAAASTRALDGSMLNASSNPALQSWMDAATQPIQQNLTQSTLPAVRNQFAQGGSYGGSRQGIAEGLASQGASQAMGATTANIANQGYSTGVDAMMKGLGLLPSTENAMNAGALTTSGIGDVRQAQSQAQLDAQNQKDLFQQYEPFLRGQDLAGVAAGLPGGSTTSTSSMPKASPLKGALTGAMGGAALGSAIMPGVGTGVGAGLGLLMSFL